MIAGEDMIIYLYYLPSEDGISPGEPVGMGGEWELSAAFHLDVASSRASSRSKDHIFKLTFRFFCFFFIPYDRLRARRSEAWRGSGALQPFNEHDHARFAVRISEVRREGVWKRCEPFFYLLLFLSLLLLLVKMQRGGGRKETIQADLLSFHFHDAPHLLSFALRSWISWKVR